MASCMYIITWRALDQGEVVAVGQVDGLLLVLVELHPSTSITIGSLSEWPEGSGYGGLFTAQQLLEVWAISLHGVGMTQGNDICQL